MADLTPLLRARSVTVIGASPKGGNFGKTIIDNLEASGFAGAIHPVHPGGEQVNGHRGYQSVGELPADIDCAVVALGAQHVPGAIDDLAAHGIRASVVFADPNVGEGRDPGIEEKVAATARGAGMSMLGMNGMGFYNLHDRVVVSGYDLPSTLRPGNVSLVSHSGTVFDTLTHSPRLAFSLAVSGGNESVTTETDYLEYLLTDPHTSVIGLYLETVRRPERFLAALSAAADRGILVVALKVGTSARGRELAQAHTGALAGGPETYASVFRRYGVHQVADLDEMVNTLHLLSSLGRRPGAGIGVVMDSGGERSMFTDLAHEAGLVLPQLSETTNQRMLEGLEDGKQPDNPLDPFGSAHLITQNFARSFEALDGDPGIDLLVLAADFQRDATYPLEYLDALESLELQAPLISLLNLPEIRRPDAMERLAGMGAPVLHGTRTGIRALAHLVAPLPDLSAPVVIGRPPEPLITDWKRRLAAAEGPLDEAASKRLLSAYGIPIPPGGVANDAGEAAAVAAQIGYPVVVKVLGIAHKTDEQALALWIEDDDMLTEALDRLAEQGERFLVERLIDHDHQLLLGVTHDEQFGPLVLLGMGGVFTEILADTSTALAPLRASDAAVMARELRGAGILRGARGGRAADLDTIIDMLLRLGTLAADFRDEIAEIDVNPLAVRGSHATALDALVIPR